MLYARINSNEQLDYYGGGSITLGDRRYSNPSPELLRAAEYRPVPTTNPARVVLSWQLVNDDLAPVYADTPATPAPRTFSKLKMLVALKQAGYWPAVKAWIEGAGLWDEYSAAQAFCEDNEFFAPALAAITTELGLTPAQAEAILDEATVY